MSEKLKLEELVQNISGQKNKSNHFPWNFAYIL